MVCLSPQLFLLIYLHKTVGLPSPQSSALPSVAAAALLQVLSTPPTGLDECFFFIYLVSDFLALRFSVSSVCARRCSVSTYTSILVLSQGQTFDKYLLTTYYMPDLVDIMANL